ncbi:DinB family protein [Kocuria sp. NPDC057446]|uniref:mycothiol transferase n=1 Tax=Kocuria sp. NPDC057446 TaxID=3346137 RepID=UPI0036C54AFB
MTPQELFEDAARRPSEVAEHVLRGITPEVLHAMPGGTANSVAWLVWHAARQQDVQVAQLAGTAEVWTTEGWSGRLDLDVPDSAMGFGDGPEDVARIRVTSPDLLRGYLDAVVERTVAYVHGLTDAELDDVVDRSWTPPVTRGARLVSTVDDAAQHLGQAAYVRGLLDGDWSGPF